MYPKLLIGPIPPQLTRLREEGYNPREISEVADLRDLIYSLSGVRRAPVIVLYDLATWSSRAQATLLKLLEESPLLILALASDDVLPGPLVSRFASVEKAVTVTPPRGDDPRFFTHQEEFPLQGRVATHAPSLLGGHLRLSYGHLPRKGSLFSLWVRGHCND